jgi:RND family efflux transporter MFP subunit
MAGDEIKEVKASIGDYVKEGQVIIEFPKDNPALQYEQAKEQYEIMKKTYDRMKNLLEAGQIAQSRFDEVETQFKVAKRNFESIKQILFVEAPISGTIISLPVRAGDLPKRDAPLFTVAQLHKMIVKVDVSEKEIGLVERGMKARAVWNGKEFEGVVTDVPLAMDLKSRSFPVEVRFDNPRKELKSGVTIEVILDAVNKEDVLTIPRSVTIEEGGNYFVYLVKDNKAAKTQIEIGAESGVEMEVMSGLMPGDTLINCCQNMLKDGKKVKIVNKGE